MKYNITQAGECDLCTDELPEQHRNLCVALLEKEIV